MAAAVIKSARRCGRSGALFLFVQFAEFSPNFRPFFSVLHNPESGRAAASHFTTLKR
jgi:hypothetical protein